MMIRKIFMAILVILTIMIITCFILSLSKNPVGKIASVKTIYNLQKGDSIKIPIYYSGNNLFDKDTLKKASISNNDRSILIPTKISDVYKNGRTSYDGESFSIVVYELSFNDDIFAFTILEAYLNLETETDNKSLLIGSVTLNDCIKEGRHIDITNLYSTVLESPETVSGIVMRISNKTFEEITIKNISFNNDNVHFDLQEITKVSEEIVANTSVNEIIKKEYNPIFSADNENRISLTIRTKGATEIFIPVVYKNISFFCETPIYITYNLEGMEYQYIMDSFTFFNNYGSLASLEEVILWQ